LYVYQRVNMMILPSMDWLKGKFTGKHHIWWEIPMVSYRFSLKPIHWYLWKLVTFHFASSRGQRRFPGTVGVPNGRNGRPRWGQKRCFSSPESAFFFHHKQGFEARIEIAHDFTNKVLLVWQLTTLILARAFLPKKTLGLHYQAWCTGLNSHILVVDRSTSFIGWVDWRHVIYDPGYAKGVCIWWTASWRMRRGPKHSNLVPDGSPVITMVVSILWSSMTTEWFGGTSMIVPPFFFKKKTPYYMINERNTYIYTYNFDWKLWEHPKSCG
jgi:hypothetical protein